MMVMFGNGYYRDINTILLFMSLVIIIIITVLMMVPL